MHLCGRSLTSYFIHAVLAERNDEGPNKAHYLGLEILPKVDAVGALSEQKKRR
jgi:hypothetical protein